MTDKIRYFWIGISAGSVLLFIGTAFAGWNEKPLAPGLAVNREIVNKDKDNAEDIKIEKREVKSANGERKVYELRYKRDALFESYMKSYDKDDHLMMQVVNHADSNTVNTLEYFPHGVIKNEKNYKDGQKEGPFREFGENGKLKIVQQYRAGKKNGLTREYSENGQIKIEAEYVDDQLSGSYTEFYPGGHAKIKSRYGKGALNGRLQEYRENDQLKIEEWYKDGKKSGIRKEYNEQGVLVWQGAYNNGNLQGTVIEYDNAGKVKSEADYDSGKLHGLTQEFYETGVLKHQAAYERDRLLVEKSFSPAGVLIEEKVYVSGVEFIVQKYYRRGNFKLQENNPMKPAVLIEDPEKNRMINFKGIYNEIGDSYDYNNGDTYDDEN